MGTTDLKGLPVQDLEAFLASIGEPRYRAKQVFGWIYKHGAGSFEEMSNLPQALRERLSAVASIGQVAISARQESRADGTMKFLIGLKDGKNVECVLIPPRRESVDAEKRMTLCISTQVGCPLDCKFCATGTMGFDRNLSSGEILDQLLTVQRISSKPITNVVFMGMGEPMLNYDNVMRSIDILSSEIGLAISPRRITVSTAGYANQIRKMADEGRKAKLALSLHSLDDAVRTKLMPVTKKHPVAELLDALEYYCHTTRKNVMLEYILFEGLNDGEADVRKIIKASKRFPCRVNLIPFHSIAFTSPRGIAASLKGASAESVARFARKLRDAGIPVFVRHSAGEDIDAACGQLAVKSSAA
ncbi:MAG TPA: 23S rRNA (adenine(2503)-C(2))-methyltransferase RlmN [Bacteroidota bacterium]|nr:23S rRNA (adenine(2503)-C(2))-methyltransferase RlmN [Bacteroidota bacterium]